MYKLVCQYLNSVIKIPKIRHFSILGKLFMKKNTRMSDNFSIKRARPIDNVQILQFLNRYIRSSESTLISRSIKLPNTVWDDYISRHLAQGLTLVAVSRVGPFYQKILGVAINSTQCSWDPDTLDKFCKCLKCKETRNLIKFFAHAMREADMNSKHDVAKIWKITFICTHPGMVSFDLGKLLTEHSLTLARGLGFKLVLMDCACLTSSNIAEKLKMKKEWEITYDDYFDEQGNKVFITRHPDTQALIYSLPLQKSN